MKQRLLFSAMLVSVVLSISTPSTYGSDIVVSGAVRTTEILDTTGLVFFDSCTPGSSIRAISSSGAVTCEPDDTGGDDLGDHTATQNISLNGHFLSGDGEDEGVWVSTGGLVGIGTAVVSTEMLTVAGNVRMPATSQIQFGGAQTGIRESGTNLTLFAEASSNADVQIEANDNVEIEPDNHIFLAPGGDVRLEPDEDVLIEPNGDVMIEPGGNVGIGNIVGSPSNILTVEQGSTTDPVADAWMTYSSDRWKTDVSTLPNALKRTLALRGVSYTSRISGERSIGVIAEEVAEVFPEVVAFEQDGTTPQAVDYGRLTAILIEAVKDQQRQIDFLLGVVCGKQQAEAFCEGG